MLAIYEFNNSITRTIILLNYYHNLHLKNYKIALQ